ncbi:MAG TPA: DUF1800 family protein [Bosea sp. (in: a-proteobacteria)]|jgi:uncharacterized protein (DUF1800 family)|uniref:DUF1800 domain-containing protein n=1 Tax=Bosea sp. (in: a-proteobacteria) TaxID=1871050 RepID=UPI002DDD62E4|nr:DUF1800 family protein [Bosea sp. (in: a-proteobacteria)]HEV2554549.1 DUF1800 family protein [Bosea sp. (in: a-proteobacteria)]
MASPSVLRSESVGLQRFGLGFGLGQAPEIRGTARERLLAEIERRVLPQPTGLPYSGAAEIGAALYAFEDAERAARQARPAAGQQVAAAAPAQNQMAQPKPANEPALPYRTYRDEVVARVRLALEPETGFGERLVQFWSNHFCIGATKSNMTRIMAGAYEREAIRPHVFGRFADMLVAAESHPAMLEFLDNRLSIGPSSPAGKRRGRGLNENLAREILELHTLGVSGGYAQVDVTNLARIITGWTVVGREAVLGFPGSFAFNAGLHEPGAPVLLGNPYGQPGKEKGLAALTDLARHPATADFIAIKLVRHFVADEPPSALVRELSAVFRKTEGDLAAVSRALIESDAAWGAEPTKIRSPQEFLLAAFRALGRKAEFGPIVGPLNAMGQPFWQPAGPNGYPDGNEAWASPEGIKTRIDVAAGWGRQAAASVPDPRALTEDILGPLLSAETWQAVARADSKPQALALMLLSPEFQRR